MIGTELLWLLMSDLDDYLPQSVLPYLEGIEEMSSLLTKCGDDFTGLLHPLEKEDFWDYLIRHEELLHILPQHPSHKPAIPWHVFERFVPVVLCGELSAGVATAAIECFVWTYHARIECDLIVLTKDAPQPAVKLARKKRKVRSVLKSLDEPDYTPVKKRKGMRFGGADDRLLNWYYQEAGKTPLLTGEEERKLAQRIQDGDQQALQKLTKANLRFVISVAKLYQNQGVTLADLIQEGNVGLIKAAKRFDWTRGFKFISYAVWWIRQSILQALSEQSRAVRLPLNRTGILFKIKRFIDAYLQTHLASPTEDEIAIGLDISLDDVRTTLPLMKAELSLDAPFGESPSDQNSLLDILEDDSQKSPSQPLTQTALHEEIMAALGTLAPREAEVMIMYFGLNNRRPMTLEEIGAKFNLTRERVRQIKEKAISRMRHRTRSKTLRAYFDQEFSGND